MLVPSVGVARPPVLSAGLLDPEPGLVVWTIVTFTLVLIVLWKFAWRPLLSSLENREKIIRDAVEGAQKLKDDAERLLEDYRKQLQEAREEARAIVDEGRRDAEELKKSMQGQARTESQELLDRAQREISLARNAAVDAVRREAVTVSIGLASKLIRRKLDPQDQQELVRGALRELEEEQ